jgi:hypothetical protein
MRGIGRSIHDLVRDVAPEADVDGPAGDLAGEILADLNGPSIVEVEPRLDVPSIGLVPWAVLQIEGGVGRGTCRPRSDR